MLLLFIEWYDWLLQSVQRYANAQGRPCCSRISLYSGRSWSTSYHPWMFAAYYELQVKVSYSSSTYRIAVNDNPTTASNEVYRLSFTFFYFFYFFCVVVVVFVIDFFYFCFILWLWRHLRASYQGNVVRWCLLLIKEPLYLGKARWFELLIKEIGCHHEVTLYFRSNN